MPNKKNKRKNKQRPRRLGETFIAEGPTGRRIRTSVRTNMFERQLLPQCLDMFVYMLGIALSMVCKANRDCKDPEMTVKQRKYLLRAETKKALTPLWSARVAGSVTRVAADMFERQVLNYEDEIKSKRAKAAAITAKAALPTGTRKAYKTPAERRAKLQKRDSLLSRVDYLETKLKNWDISICIGGKDLANTRHHLEEAELTLEQYKILWRVARWRLVADGDKRYEYGNGIIDLDPFTGEFSVYLPTHLRHFSNTKDKRRYVFENPVRFSQPKASMEWAYQAITKSVRYDIFYNLDRDRWYLDASWAITPSKQPTLEQLRKYNFYGLDMNTDHIAGWACTPDGNFLGRPRNFECQPEGSTEQRAGYVCRMIVDILDEAASHDCAAIVIENLNFEEHRDLGVDNPRIRRGKAGRVTRHKVANMPTAKFRHFLVSMAHKRGIAVVVVDPAYTSKWSKHYWLDPINSLRKKKCHYVTSHQAASFIIGRRGHDHSAKRRCETDVKRASEQVKSNLSRTVCVSGSEAEAIMPVTNGECLQSSCTPDASQQGDSRSLSEASSLAGVTQSPSCERDCGETLKRDSAQHVNASKAAQSLTRPNSVVAQLPIATT